MIRLTRTIGLATFVALAMLSSGSSAQQATRGFDAYFADKTMRVDYFHSGGMGQEILALERVVSDGPWPGSRTRLVDDSNLGKYLFEVIDRTTNAVIYSRGFASIYGEWETTAEYKTLHRTFPESLRFPWPKSPVQVVLKKRDAENAFREIWSTTIDPESRFVNPADLPAAGTLWTVFENGPAASKVDLLVISEGYAANQMDKFHRDVQRLVGRLFEYEPFKSRRADFNVRALDLPSSKPGVNRARAKSFRRTPMSVEFNIFDSERYVLTYDDRTLRNVAASAPYEFIEVLVNEEQYGGGGIFNFQATASVDHAYAEYVFVHEFGHHFAGLADEYYTSDVAYETGATEHVEPWEPNATAMHDPSRLKWRDLVEKDTPLPTPWDKDAYETQSRASQAQRRKLLASGAPQSEIDKLFRAEEGWSTKLLGGMKYSRKVGAFEGAAYEAKGLYRPSADCIMFTRDPVGFCPVCRRAIERVIDLYARP